MTLPALPRLLRVVSFRFAALYVGLFAVSSFILGAAVFIEARSALEHQLRSRVGDEVGFLQDAFRENGVSRLVALVRARERRVGALDYLVQDGSGGHLAGEIPAQPGLGTGWTTLVVHETTSDGRQQDQVRALVVDLGQGMRLAVGGDLRQVEELQEAIVAALLSSIGLAAVLGIGGGVLLSRAFLLRIDNIGRTAEAIIGGDLTQRIPMRGTGDDLDRLAATLNRMLDRIGTLMDSLRQVSSDVAHDLRTPLARLYQRLEEARTHAASVRDYETAVEAALDEAAGLLDTFGALLRIAQVEGATARDGFRVVDLSELADRVVDAYRLDAETSGHRLRSEIAPALNALGDRELLTQALANLVENALRHTPAGTQVTVRLQSSPDGIALSVEDDGPGVADADLPRLTDRFFRAETSRTTPGNGLGLSLVVAVAELHGARMVIEGGNPGLRCVIGGLRPACAAGAPRPAGALRVAGCGPPGVGRRRR